MDIFTYEGRRRGGVFLLLGGVHGDEPCGPAAITRLMGELNDGTLVIDQGTLVCVPRANEKALAQNVRFLDANLNRILGFYDKATHEGTLVPALRTVLDQADHLLDLHSYSAGGPPFVFASEDSATMAFARAMPAQAVITGWQECYRRAFPETVAAGVGTTEYARSHGCRAITFECGGHLDPAAPENGYRAAIAALRHLSMLAEDDDVAPNPRRRAPEHIRMKNVFVKSAEGGFAREWKHLEPISENEVFARYTDGQEVRAAQDGVVVLPFPAADVGVEWGYFGVRVKPLQK